jgi:hypothetical protein
MSSLAQIRANALELPNEELRRVCVSIVDEVQRRFEEGRSAHWTFKTFASWAGRREVDDVVYECVVMLATKESIRLLDMHFLFFNPTDDSSPGESIDDDEVSEAFKTGYLIDPDSGDKVDEFEKNLVPYFVPSATLSDPHANAK